MKDISTMITNDKVFGIELKGNILNIDNISFDGHLYINNNQIKIDEIAISNILFKDKVVNHKLKSKRIKIDFSKIKQIIFHNCELNYLPSLFNMKKKSKVGINCKIWNIEFNNCTINNCSDIVNFLKPLNKNKRVLFYKSNLSELHFGDIKDIKHNLNK